MTTSALPRDTLLPRAPAGDRRGIGLSLLVHAGLIAALAFGVNWRSRTPEAQQAELWASVPQAAAPRAVEPEATPAPAPAVAPPSPPPPQQPTAKTEPPPAAVPEPDAQIAIEKARAAKARQQQEAAEREALRRRQEADKLAAQRAAAEKAAAEKAAADKLAAEKARQQQVEKQKALDAQKAAQAKAAQEQQAADERQARQREADRKKNIERMLGQAGASGEPGATGSAQQSAGPSAGYAGRIQARIRPNIVFADEVAGNPTAEVEVRAGPDGTILGRKLVKSSGVAAYDNAVLRAIDKTEVLPRDIDGRVPSPLLLVFRVRE